MIKEYKTFVKEPKDIPNKIKKWKNNNPALINTFENIISLQKEAEEWRAKKCGAKDDTQYKLVFKKYLEQQRC